MQTTMSPIALRGFVLGYMSKTAERGVDVNPAVAGLGEGDVDPTSTTGKITNLDPNAGAIPNASDSTRMYAGGRLGDQGPMSSRHSMKEMLKQLLPGAGVGAAVGAGGSALMDQQQGNPINMRRMALVAALMAPAGMAGQLALGSAGIGKGPSLGEFGRGAADMAGQGVGAAKGAFQGGLAKAKSMGSNVKADLS